MGVWDDAAAVRKQTEAGNATAITVWTNGIERLARSLEQLAGYQTQRPQVEQVQFGLLGHALNVQLTAYWSALHGFPVQILPLARRCAEDWLAFWYVQNFPRKARVFLDPSLKTPDWNSMLEKLESKHKGRQAEARNWRAWLNGLSHVGQIPIKLMWDHQATDHNLLIGPTYQPGIFDGCAGEFATALPPLIEGADVLCLSCGRQPADPGGMSVYHVELTAWLKANGMDSPA